MGANLLCCCSARQSGSFLMTPGQDTCSFNLVYFSKMLLISILGGVHPVRMWTLISMRPSLLAHVVKQSTGAPGHYPRALTPPSQWGNGGLEKESCLLWLLAVIGVMLVPNFSFPSLT